MTAITDISDIVNRMTGGNSGTPENLFVWIDGRVDSAAAVATVSGRWTSLWQYNKSRGGFGATPGAVAIPTNSTNGGLIQANPGGGRQKWLLGHSAVSNSAGTLLLYDRLLHVGGLSGTTATAQTVGGTLTRNTGGAGNQIWVEIYTQIGASSTTITASYTNQSGTSGRTTKAVAIGNTGLREAQRMIPLPLAAGDTGVQAVASCTLAATTGTAGSFGITVVRPIATGNIISASLGYQRDFIAGLPSLPEIDTNACLSLAWYANTTTIPNLFFNLNSIEK